MQSSVLQTVGADSPVFLLYRTVCRYRFESDEVTRAHKQMLEHRPVGKVIITTLAEAQPRIELSHYLTLRLDLAGLPCAVRHAYPPHGLYYYLPLEGAPGAPGMPARIYHYDDVAQRVTVVLGNSLDSVAGVDPHTELRRVDTDTKYGWTPNDLVYLYQALGGISHMRNMAAFSDPLGFLPFGM